ncbi:hypothetical protein GGI20_006095, partial [Coemansia sp. BCRC 34301]
KKYTKIADAKTLWEKPQWDFTYASNALICALVRRLANAKYEGSARKFINNYKIIMSFLHQLKLSPSKIMDLVVITKIPQEMHYRFQDVLSSKVPGVPFDMALIAKCCKEHEEVAAYAA